MPAALSTLRNLVEPQDVGKLVRSFGLQGIGLVLAFTASRKTVQASKRELYPKRDEAPSATGSGGEAKRGKKPKGAFSKELRKLLSICIPKVFSAETGFLALVAFMLILRTGTDIWRIRNDTAIERSIIGGNRRDFARNLAAFGLSMIPVTLVNQLLKLGLRELALRFRANLSRKLHELIMRGHTFYALSSLEKTVQNADQLLTQDVDRFAQSLADVYSNVSKPILDIVLYSAMLCKTVGYHAPASMIGYLIASGIGLTIVRKALARLTVAEQRLEGEYRFAASRVLTNAEEIAFFRGNEHERGVLDRTFSRLERLLRHSLHFRFSTGVIDDVIAKYFATVVGFTTLAMYFFSNRDVQALPTGERMELYYRSGRMLINLAGSIGRLVLAGRETTRLAGFTRRVSELFSVIHRIHRETQSAQPEQSEDIEFRDVPIMTPVGDELVPSLTMKIERGTNVLVAGPNGCGKSSLFRILGGLWKTTRGTLSRPPLHRLFYIPQRPYMPLGTMRDQITYPDTKKRASDDELTALLEVVGLSHIVAREGGMDSVKDWMNALSGGEKQRMAFARLYFHKPAFAILDECTSAVSVDVEDKLYKHCEELGITLLTVSHRKSLWKHHEKVLRFDGSGGVVMEEINHDDESSVFGS